MGNQCGTVDVDRPAGSSRRGGDNTVYAPALTSVRGSIDVDGNDPLSPPPTVQKQELMYTVPLPYQGIRAMLDLTREKRGQKPTPSDMYEEPRYGEPHTVTITKIKNQVGLRVHTDRENGCIITKVTDRSAGDFAGCKAGMKILKIGERDMETTCKNRKDVQEAFQAQPDGTPFTMLVRDPPAEKYEPLTEGNGSSLEILLHAARTQPLRNLQATAHIQNLSGRTGSNMDLLLRAGRRESGTLSVHTSDSVYTESINVSATAPPVAQLDQVLPAGTVGSKEQGAAPAADTPPAAKHVTAEDPATLSTPAVAKRVSGDPATPTAVTSSADAPAPAPQNAQSATTATSPTSSVGPARPASPPTDTPAARKPVADNSMLLTDLAISSTATCPQTSRTQFVVTFTLGAEKKQAMRYYTDFDELRKRLQKDGKQMQEQFPQKTAFSKCTGAALDKRRVMLGAWLRELLRRFGPGSPNAVTGQARNVLDVFLKLQKTQWTTQA